MGARAYHIRATGKQGASNFTRSLTLYNALPLAANKRPMPFHEDERPTESPLGRRVVEAPNSTAVIVSRKVSDSKRKLLSP